MQYVQSPATQRSPLDPFPKKDQDESLSTAEENKALDEEEKKRQIGDLTDWLYYGRAIGGPVILCCIVFTSVACFGLNFQSKSEWRPICLRLISIHQNYGSNGAQKTRTYQLDYLSVFMHFPVS
jgi:hypothetical protein